MTAGNRRHYIDVYRPSQATDLRGQIEGPPETIYRGMPAEIRTLSTREQEVARQVYALATHEVRVMVDPRKQIMETDYLMHGARKLEVGGVNDVQQNGVEMVLICGEVRNG